MTNSQCYSYLGKSDGERVTYEMMMMQFGCFNDGRNKHINDTSDGLAGRAASVIGHFYFHNSFHFKLLLLLLSIIACIESYLLSLSMFTHSQLKLASEVNWSQL